MKRLLWTALGTCLLILTVWAGLFYWRNLRGAGPAFTGPPRDIARLMEQTGANAPASKTKNYTGFPLKLPPGFSISIFAKNLGSPRVLALDPEGTLLASIPSQGRIVALPDKNRDGEADAVVTVISGLHRPHGFAFHPQNPKKLYIAEVEHLATYDYDPQNFRASSKRNIIDLPPAGRHWTRTLLFLPAAAGVSPVPSWRLLISVGSSCDTCVEKDWRYAAVLVSDPDGKNLKPFATGLRNAVFMTRHPATGQVWVTEMGRDFLGYDLPPDEIDIVQEGKDYGWPWCYGKQVHDANFDPAGKKKDFCKTTIPSYINIPAHSAPLGLAFIPAAPAWPREYHHNLLVAYHGSWNRTVPTGYKVVRYRLDSQGKYLGEKDFFSGWLTHEGALGRPADILVSPEGLVYISDDKAGVVYRLDYIKDERSS